VIERSVFEEQGLVQVKVWPVQKLIFLVCSRLSEQG